MANKRVELAVLVRPGVSDSISGRDTGMAFDKRIDLLESLEKGDNVEIVIDSKLVKAINDSFIKGLFSRVFARYRSIDQVRKRVKIIADDYYVKLFEKNWAILQAINNV